MSCTLLYSDTKCSKVSWTLYIASESAFYTLSVLSEVKKVTEAERDETSSTQRDFLAQIAAQTAALQEAAGRSVAEREQVLREQEATSQRLAGMVTESARARRYY